MADLIDRRQVLIGLASILAAGALSPFAITGDGQPPAFSEQAAAARRFDSRALVRRAPPPEASAPVAIG